MFPRFKILPTPPGSPKPVARMTHLEAIARETGISLSSVTSTAKLLAEGGTVPFLSRYRKEQTGSLDEVQITTIRDRMLQLAELDSRRSTVLKSLEERSLLTPELKKKLEAALTLATVEDIFAPYRPKRQTRATKAVERGLTPLADFIFENQSADPEEEAAKFLNPEMEVPTTVESLAGARDIIAERVADDAPLRGRVRKIYEEDAMVSSKIMYGKEEEADAQKFRDYFEWSEPFKTIPSHRTLAIRRGEKEGFLLMRVEVPLERVVSQALARLGEIQRPRRQTRRPGRRGRLQAPAHAVDGNRGPPDGEKTRRRDRHHRLRRQLPRALARLATW